MLTFIKNILPFNNREDMPKPIYVIKKLLAFFLCLYGAGIICEVIIIAAMTALGKDPLHGDMFEPAVMDMITYYGYAAVIALIILYWKLVEKKTVAELGFTNSFGSYFIGWGAAVVLLGASVAAITLTGALVFNGVFSEINTPVILIYFGGFIFQGMYEEVLTRGILLQTLRRKLSLPWAIAISSAPFIILHLSSMTDGGVYSVLGVANLAAVAVVFSMLTVITDNIWTSCGMHSLWNFMLYNILGLNLSGSEGKVAAVFDVTAPENSVLNGGSYGIEASVITLVVLMICAAALIVFYRRKKNA